MNLNNAIIKEIAEFFASSNKPAINIVAMKVIGLTQTIIY